MLELCIAVSRCCVSFLHTIPLSLIIVPKIKSILLSLKEKSTYPTSTGIISKQSACSNVYMIQCYRYISVILPLGYAPDNWHGAHHCIVSCMFVCLYVMPYVVTFVCYVCRCHCLFVYQRMSLPLFVSYVTLAWFACHCHHLLYVANIAYLAYY